MKPTRSRMVTAAAAQQRKDPEQALHSVVTRQDAIDLFTSKPSTSK
jgi:hypothetical protein